MQTSTFCRAKENKCRPVRPKSITQLCVYFGELAMPQEDGSKTALDQAYGSKKHKDSGNTLSLQPRLNSEQFTAWKKCGQGFHQQPKASSEADKRKKRAAVVEEKRLYCTVSGTQSLKIHLRGYSLWLTAVCDIQ